LIRIKSTIHCYVNPFLEFGKIVSVARLATTKVFEKIYKFNQRCLTG